MFPGSWKSTAIWSGTTALATWLASTTPVGTPADTGSVSRTRLDAAATQAVVVQMQELNEEAERLARRLSDVEAYRAPARDPFRFKPLPAPPVATSVAASVPAAAEAPLSAPPPPFTLSGIAEDRLGDVIVRTAIVAGSGELWLVKAGETVDGKFEVTAVDADAVELIRADTGTAIRLSFRP